jgi:hypothetical protein
MRPALILSAESSRCTTKVVSWIMMSNTNYKVYWTHLELSDRDFERMKRSLIPRIYDDRDDALACARDCIKAGLLVHLT